MYISCGYRHHSTDGNHQAAVAFYAVNMTLGSFEWTSNDPYPVALMVFGSVVAQQLEAFSSSGDYKTEHFHLTVYYYGWLSASILLI